MKAFTVLTRSQWLSETFCMKLHAYFSICQSNFRTISSGSGAEEV